MNRIGSLITSIAALQFKEDNNKYNAGAFPAQRFHSFLPYVREDNMMFFNGLVAFTLQRHLSLMDKEERRLAEQLIHAVTTTYSLYQSLSTPFVINFYQTRTSTHFPNGYILHRFGRFAPADDADCSVIAAMSYPTQPEGQFESIRKLLVKFSNLERKKVTHFDSQYTELPVYGTWLGSGAMPIEIDVCVMSNIMYYIFKNTNQLNKQEIASMHLLSMAIDNKDIITKPEYMSFTYPKQSVILYHISRLCTAIEDPSVYLPIDKLIRLIKNQLELSTKLMERIILSTALMNLGETSQEITYPLDPDKLEKSFREFSYFSAPMLSGTTNPILNKLKGYKLFNIGFRSKAYYYTLMLEHELLRKSLKS